jgi:hypothetical protein
MSSPSPSPSVFWPEKYRPKTAHIYARDEIGIPAKPEIIWAWLIRADLWLTWYLGTAKSSAVLSSRWSV